MKSIRYRFILCLLIIIPLIVFSGCTSEALEGSWNVCELSVEGKEQKIFESNIKFVREGKRLVAKGCAGVNLYNANIEVKGKSIKASAMTNTGFNGTRDEMDYENLFFEAFIHSDSFKIKNEMLYIYNHDKNMELKLKK